MTYQTCFIMGTSYFIRSYPEILSHVFYCKFDQAVFKNSCSRKILSDIKNKGSDQSIDWYLNSYGPMLIVLFLWESFTKPLNKLKYGKNTFWKVFYAAIYSKIYQQTLLNLATVKARGFYNSVVAVIKRTLWRRAGLLKCKWNLLII